MFRDFVAGAYEESRAARRAARFDHFRRLKATSIPVATTAISPHANA